jgi:YD repeat-containing protein
MRSACIAATVAWMASGVTCCSLSGCSARHTEVDPLNNKRTWEYNGDSQEIAMVSPRGNVTGGKPAEFTTKTERDGAGQVVKQVDGNKHATKYKRNVLEEVTEVTDPPRARDHEGIRRGGESQNPDRPGETHHEIHVRSATTANTPTATPDSSISEPAPTTPPRPSF